MTPLRPACALLFDLDGTLLDTDPIHAAVFVELMSEHGIALRNEAYFERIHGRMNEAIFAEFLPDADAQALSLDKEARFRARLGARVPPTPGLVALIARARNEGWSMAVVTNAPRANAVAMLAAIGLTDAFDALVIGEECARGKPDPAPYLEAMARLGVAAARCLAFEDSPSGLRAARASGATVIGLRSALDHRALIDAGADDSIADFADPALAPHLDRLRALGAEGA